MDTNSNSTPPGLPQDVRESLTAIIDYLWEDELKHARETGGNCIDSYPAEHVIGHLARVREWLTGALRTKRLRPEAGGKHG